MILRRMAKGQALAAKFGQDSETLTSHAPFNSDRHSPGLEPFLEENLLEISVIGSQILTRLQYTSKKSPRSTATSPYETGDESNG